MELPCLQCASCLDRAIDALRLVEQTLDWSSYRFEIDLSTNAIVGGSELLHRGKLVKFACVLGIIHRDERKLNATSECILDPRKSLERLRGLIPST